MTLDTDNPVALKCKAIIEKYEAEYRMKPLNLAVPRFISDPEYQFLTPEEKAVFALIVCTIAH